MDNVDEREPATAPEPCRTPAGVAIRRLAQSDARALEQLMSDRAVYATGLDLPHTSTEQWQLLLARAGPNDHHLGAIHEGRLIGWASLQVCSEWRRRHAAALGIAVARAWWRRGVGKVLIDELLVLADDWLHLQRIELSAFANNDAALSLYQRFGFEVEGLQRGWAFQEGRFVDAYLMARLHPAPARIEPG
jgi:L-phenylalanine/L-methionine N-acetyltransferase